MSEAAKGRKVSKQGRENMSESQKGKKWMNKNGIEKMVYPDDIDWHINNEWIFGRLKGKK